MRRPAASGMFYPRDAFELRRAIAESFRGLEKAALQALGAVVPHAGYIYSGKVAAEVYARLPYRDTYVLIGPNHTGQGLPVAMSKDSWMTPFGVVDCDIELADSLLGSIIELDETAHMYEHSIEVQLPFLQHCFTNFKILPISLGFQDEDVAVEVGEAIARAAEDLGRNCTVIASSDFTHYESEEAAHKKDAHVIEAAIRMDVGELYRRVYGRNVTACGYGPIAATITASRMLGATSGKLLRYSTSGDVSGDYAQVVGYGAIVFL